tara:strand:+ start:835 stop:1110 length:276 start_codon:yes stop_codon:yes gene_type:complete
MSRGRPKLAEEVPPPRQFTKVYDNSDGTTETWHYNLDKFSNGPFKVDIKYSTSHLTFEEINEALPKTQRRYYNPANQKYIGYGRAKQLGLL